MKKRLKLIDKKYTASFSLKKIGLFLFVVGTIIGFTWLFWPKAPAEISSVNKYEKAGQVVEQSLVGLASLPVAEEDDAYVITDTVPKGIQIQFAGNENTATQDSDQAFQVRLPKNYQDDPVEVKLDNERIVRIHDTGKEGKSYNDSVFTRSQAENLHPELPAGASWWGKLFGNKNEQSPEYIGYKSSDGRKMLYYAYAHDQATGEKILKHWAIYTHGNASGKERESYRFENAKLRLTESGKIEVSYYGEKEKQNTQALAEVDQSLLDRAQRTLEKETGQGLEGQQSPDFVIPEAYYIDAEGNHHDATWQLSEDGQEIFVEFTPAKEEYPLAFDPTLSFAAPGQSNTGTTITGAASTNFGYGMTSGDFNADGKIDLAVGAYTYSSGTGRIYIFYNDGSLSTTAVAADIIITGENAGDYFGVALASGDLNADGKIDLVVGANAYSSAAGRAYIFYNDDGSFQGTATKANVIITGEASSEFGRTFATGDFNADGKADLAVGAYQYSSGTGRAYIFHNDGSIPTTAGTADVIIDGENASDYFGQSLTAGDFNADGKTDITIGAYGYSANTGRAYIFHNDGSIPTTAGTADVIITGQTTGDLFGYALASGDSNADGKADLMAGAYGYSSGAGRVYIFYNDSSIPTTAGTADVIITGESGAYFGESFAIGDFNADGKVDFTVGAEQYSSGAGRVYIFYSQNGQINTNQSITGEASSQFGHTALAAGDFNADGKIDLVVGALGYSTNTGRAYIFYNDGSIATTAATADVIITGNAANDQFGQAVTAGDFNADGTTDLAVAAPGYSSVTGRTYIFYNDGSYPTTAATANVTITGEATTFFGRSLAAGDFNSDGRVDLVVSGSSYSSSTGRTYIFYNDGSIPTAATSADVIITGEASSSFGFRLTAGDFNMDSRIDLAISAYNYSSSTGRTYIFYNDGSIPTAATSADVIITGEASSNFGSSLTAGDFNTDGRTDLAVGAYGYSSSAGRAYVFYNDGSIPTAATSADVIITGTSGIFGYSLAAGDFNADGKTDLAAGSNGSAYVFYNDGAYPTSTSDADISIAGASGFGSFITSGDFNADGKTDLVISAYAESSSAGKVYFYETRDNYAWQLQPQSPSGSPRVNPNIFGQELKITGAYSQYGYFGDSFGVGDFNNDGKTDLIVSAPSLYGSAAGHLYIFYNNGSTQSSFSGADVTITDDDTTGNQQDWPIAVGDFNADGTSDFAFGNGTYSSSTGRVYIFYNDGSYPTSTTTADVIITGEASSKFGSALATGDFNSDGTIDLAVGALFYSTNTGRTYIFHNDGSIPTTAGTADITITGGTTNNRFGASLASGDFNRDGRVDLAVGAWQYSSSTGRVYIFYNDGSIPTTAGTANVIITGGTTNNRFGQSLAAGDFNADGRIDLAVGADQYSANTGRAYIFYNDGAIPTTAGTADVTITGDASTLFGVFLTAGDFNADGRTDLVVGAPYYSTQTGRAYIFYNDGTIPTTAATADVTLTGETTNSFFGYSLASGDFNADGKTDLIVGGYQYSAQTGRAYIYTSNDSIVTGQATGGYLGYSLAAGDFNADGKTDLAAGAYRYSSNAGRVYIFYNDGSVSSVAASADVIISGETSSYFGSSLAVGDLNGDGRIDLAVGAYGYSTNTGRAYIFYNDGSIPTTAASADVIITGEATSNAFGSSGGGLVAGDFNADGTIDLVVAAGGYSSNTGRAYIFYNDGSYPSVAGSADVIITGDASGDAFGASFTAGDFNADGKIDLAAGSQNYSTQTGRAYIFYNDGSYPSVAGSADVIITGDASGDYFGFPLASGDFNADGKTDLVVGTPYYSTFTGRAYIFYNDGSYPSVAGSADVIITGEGTSNLFAYSFAVSDFNADGKTDLAIGATGVSSSAGRAYIFYNDGSYPSAAGSADVTITGDTSSALGYSLAAGDFNTDSITDLAGGGAGYSTNTGRVYIIISEAFALSPPSQGTVKLKGTGIFQGSFRFQ